MSQRVLWHRGRDTFDEIVVPNCTIHVEQMSDQCYWMGVYKGKRQSLHVNFTVKGRSPIRATFYDDSDHRYPWKWDEDREHL